MKDPIVSEICILLSLTCSWMQADARDSLVDLTVSLLTLRTVRHRRPLDQ